jgi:hypothetical protein
LGSIGYTFNKIQNLVKIDNFPELVKENLRIWTIFRYFELILKIDPKFDENHEYLDLFGVTRIFTQLLTNLETGSRHKSSYRKFNK